MLRCATCKGRGTIAYSVETLGKADVVAVGGESTTNRHSMTCFVCIGIGKITPDQAERERRLQEMWCRCGNPSKNVTHHPDAPGSKHHWTCDDCGKVTQVG